MRTFTQTLKFFFLACALMLAATPAWGNTVSSANSSSDVKSGKLEMKGEHATFKLSGISSYEYNWRSYNA